MFFFPRDIYFSPLQTDYINPPLFSSQKAFDCPPDTWQALRAFSQRTGTGSRCTDSAWGWGCTTSRLEALFWSALFKHGTLSCEDEREIRIASKAQLGTECVSVQWIQLRPPLELGRAQTSLCSSCIFSLSSLRVVTTGVPASSWWILSPWYPRTSFDLDRSFLKAQFPGKTTRTEP